VTALSHTGFCFIVRPKLNEGVEALARSFSTAPRSLTPCRVVAMVGDVCGGLRVRQIPASIDQPHFVDQ
jgi:phage FluMu protein gp41